MPWSFPDNVCNMGILSGREIFTSERIHLPVEGTSCYICNYSGESEEKGKGVCKVGKPPQAH